MYTLDRTETIPTTFGAFSFVAGEPTHVPDEAAAQVLRAGAVKVDDTEATEAEAKAAEAPTETPAAETPAA